MNIRTNTLFVSAIALCAWGTFASAQSTSTSSDQAFVTAASEAGPSEIALGQLASQQGSAPSVRAFGDQMIKDHGAADDQLKSIATSEHLTLSPGPNTEDQAAAHSLGQLKGGAFDAQYAKKAVADHQKAVALFRNESLHGHDAQLRSFATTTLPTLQHHLKMAQALRGHSADTTASTSP